MVAGSSPLCVPIFFHPALLQFRGIGPVADGSKLPSTLLGGFDLVAHTGIFSQACSMMSSRRRTQNNSRPAH